MKEWLARLRHDLVRPLVWRARDVREDDLIAEEGEKRRLLAAVLDELYDGEGRPITALALWQEIAADAPASLDARARQAFADALAHAVEVVSRVGTTREQPIDAAYAAIAALDVAFAALGPR